MSDDQNKSLFSEISGLSTEQRNPKSMDIDAKPTAEILKLINDEDKTVPYVVEKELPYIEQAVELIVNALKKGGALSGSFAYSFLSFNPNLIKIAPKNIVNIAITTAAIA